MADKVSPIVRSKIMRAIKHKNTKPEHLVRSCLFKAGLRYRLHVKELPGKPDIVLRKYRTIIFVHGCFWHQHPGCRYARVPASNESYWGPKLRKTQERDKAHVEALQRSGWKVIILWECEILEPQLEAVLGEILHGSDK
ncbi:very short patch repair endonuclease [Methylogaea oryzae]|uniref:very short patch repair endonuclease n=1 Tax=Methylogaea oryzae TaxID=1295382 RepID=UPI0009E80568|nr:very short patch repair endonuclease [Methylogaea oryzae]